MAYRLRIDRLRAAANKAGDISGIAIAQRTGLSESQVSRLLRGRNQPTFSTLLRFRQAYGMTEADLVEELAA